MLPCHEAHHPQFCFSTVGTFCFCAPSANLNCQHSPTSCSAVGARLALSNLTYSFNEEEAFLLAVATLVNSFPSLL